MNRKEIKNVITTVLHNGDLENDLAILKKLPRKKVINALFSGICHTDSRVKWHAVELMGHLIARLADDDPEAARTFIRRFIWNLNEESGGIGWGGPEVMGEIFALQNNMAEEFAQMLVSFIREDGAFLEYDLLQQGVLWGLGRLAQVRPQILNDLDTGLYLQPFLHSDENILRGLAAWGLGLLKYGPARSDLEKLLQVPAEISLFCKSKLMKVTVQQLAHDAIHDMNASL